MSAGRRTLPTRVKGWAAAATLLLTVATALPASAQSAVEPPLLLHGRWEGAIGPMTVSYFDRLLALGHQAGAEGVVVELETPGGLDLSMRDIVKGILGSQVPVIVYVHPAGARSASAGVFITMAAHLAAMTPGTNIGAASPVAIGGQMDSTMAAKVTNDAAAYARSIAHERGRNAEWAEQAVRKAVSATAEEAVAERIVDLLATDFDDLLIRLDGRSVRLPSGPRVLHTAGARVQDVPLSLRERLLALLADPNIAYIFMLLGIYGLIFELQNPGTILPGVVGVISLLIAFMSFQTLPLNYAGLALIVLAVVLFVLEIKIPSYGLLTLGGIVAMVLGSLMLFDTMEPAMRVSLQVIITMVVLTVLFFAFAIGLGLRAQRLRVTTGREGMEGETGKARTRLEPEGSISVHGEIWQARSMSGMPIEAGSRVKVVKVEGLLLYVLPATEETAGA
jgi:membrane-bound serine protease (ClpP class)